MTEKVTLAMGGGGKATGELIEEVFAKELKNKYFTSDDAAVLPAPAGRMAMSTDGFIVSPAIFPGGNVGKLSVCGTVNDLACMGARPLYLTCSFVIEEGFPIADLKLLVSSMARTAREVGVMVVAGDTKVARRGQADGCFITTAGVGEIMPGVSPAGNRARQGDTIIVTGDIGRHAAAIAVARDEFGIESDVTSDCAPLWKPVEAVLKEVPDVHVIRDATRGGVGTVLHEISRESGVGIRVDRDRIPVDPKVQGICDMLGFDPLNLACEGRMVIIAEKEREEEIIKILHGFEYTSGACAIGEVRGDSVTVKTPIGTETYLPEASTELLPRIC
ncbi:MAG: hydrogenase expression/formation protein HypE [Lachnospiraceae bacterium]|nr:hydrogenase expression/formation protein HypE [Lachnospiraceae bacterium]